MKVILRLACVLLLSSPALAGIRYTMHVQTEDSGKRSEIIQNSWLQGAQAKIIFDEGVNALREVDADRFGAVAYSVDPNTRRSTRIILSKPSKLSVLIENIVTTKTVQESGPMVLGHPTTHYVFTSEFDYTENNDTLHGTMIHELWAASDLADFDLMSWMMFEYRLRQDRGIESLFREVSTLGRGLPLAYDGIARIHDHDGNTRIIRIGATVESLEQVNVDPSVFSDAPNTFEVIAGQ